MSLRRFAIRLAVALLSIPCAKAQDVFFTQLFANPLELNPALAGAFDGSYRLSASYRDQWSGLTDSPYRTYAISTDLRFPVGLRGQDFAGGGLSFLADRVPVFDFNTTTLRLTGAFHKLLDQRTRQYISAGLMFGMVKKNINIEQLTFNDQFNGLDDYTFPTNEFLPENNFGFFDLGIGVNYAVTPSNSFQFSAGGSIIHLHQPSAGFGIRTDEIDNAEDIKLFRYYNAYASSIITLRSEIQVLPRLSAAFQGPHMFLNAGSNVRFIINDYKTNFLLVGAGARFARSLDALAPATAYLFTGIELNKFLLGLSYDFNLGDLADQQVGSGILEISIRYVGEYDNSGTFCPSF